VVEDYEFIPKEKTGLSNLKGVGYFKDYKLPKKP
jgi:hypothetical protein